VRPKRPWRGTQQIGVPLHEANRHTIVFAPTRIGKTAGLIAPWIVEGVRAGYRVVAVDVKGNRDLADEVQKYRDSLPIRDRLPFMSWDYRDPAHSKSWNFISDLRDDGDFNAAAEAICGKPRDNDPNANFHARDLKWMKGLLEVAASSGQQVTVRGLLNLLISPITLQNGLRQLPQSRGSQRLADLAAMTPSDFSRATQFLTTYLETLNNDGFVDVTSQTQVTMDDIAFGDPRVVIVNAPIVDGELASSASGLFLAMLIRRRLNAFNSSAPPMLLILDECPRLQDRLDLGQLVSLAAGANVSVMLAAQDVSQFDEDKRHEIIANCGTFVLLGGANHTTTKYVMDNLGERRATKYTSGDTHHVQTGRASNFNVDSELVSVMGHNELVNPPSGPFGATVINNRLSSRPILVDLTRDDLLTAP
jgi:type IV secretory pathway TraG/TraD family ATPase VirD4